MSKRTFVVPRAQNGQSLETALRGWLHLSGADVRHILGERRVRLDGHACADPRRRLQRGQRVEVFAARTAQRQPKRQQTTGRKRTAIQPIIRFADPHLVIVDKPAGLTTMRHGYEAREFGDRGQRFLPPTLADLLPALLSGGKQRPARVIAVHRLDRDTSGLVVFARMPAAAQELGRQFRTHSIERRYLALVRGRAEPRRIESWLVPDRGDGRRGSGDEVGQGVHAITHVRVVEALGDFTLVECRLETGRTHQVRIHLGEQGWPICGERIYDRPLHGRPLPDTSGGRRLALHAASLRLVHPVTGKQMHWDSPLPVDLAGLLKRLRTAASREET